MGCQVAVHALLLLLAACNGGSGDTQPSSEAATPSRWQPSTSSTWQLQLTGPLNTGYPVSVYDIDLYDSSASAIAALRASGKRVICYFSAGSSEDWRPDFAQFSAAEMGRALDGWVGERWLDTRSANVRAIMTQRLDLAARKGCDGVDPDNVDGYTHDTGFPLTAATQLDYNRFLAAESHARGLAVGLKNDVDQINELEPHFDFAVNEQCHEYGECAAYGQFISNGKPVFNVEYAAAYRDNTGGARDQLCASARAADMRTLVQSIKLDDSYRHTCD
jgi:hypothetical protein